jgi:hypothetical protein
VRAEPKQFAFRYRSAEHFLEVFREYYGPTLRLFDALDEAGRRTLSAEVLDLVRRLNRATDGTMVVESEYLEVVLTKH